MSHEKVMTQITNCKAYTSPELFKENDRLSKVLNESINAVNEIKHSIEKSPDSLLSAYYGVVLNDSRFEFHENNFTEIELLKNNVSP